MKRSISPRKATRRKTMKRESSIDRPEYQPQFLGARHYFVLLVMFSLLAGLVTRALYLQVVEQDFLTSQGGQRQIRTIETPAYRGSILDRFGTPLAISTPVDSVWVNPTEILANLTALKQVTDKLELDFRATVTLLKQRANREFVYLKRQLEPDFASAVAGGIDGVYLQREYNRYYPAGEVVSHLVGFTDIDDRGQEGLELAYQDWLSAQPGKRRVIRNRHGEVIEELAQVSRAESGKDIYSSIDMRLQYIAYRSLARAIQYHAARAGSAVLLDARSGEILAMVNQPSYNPNRRHNMDAAQQRNRALTDVFEPGSTIKPFTVAAAIDRGRFHAGSTIDTSPGHWMVSGHAVKDVRNFGVLSLSDILRRSSNVGASRIAMSMHKEEMWESFKGYGFGEASGVSFPGETSGYFPHHSQWQPLDHATMGFGYGMSVSITQLARAYAVIANEGRLLDLSLVRKEVETSPHNQIARHVMKASTAHALIKMMAEVVGPKGTAHLAAIPGYQVAGKTGTARKSIAGGYQKDDYVAVFAGIAPVSNPRLVMAIMIDEPTQNGYYGGLVAAPVFSDVVSNALRILDIPPDDLPTLVQSREQGA
ncbi:MAG: penicillin-binding protein 2 [Gammaproteobacteria bacterium]|jgi:cell division protein FtsI (penicillin-binding protein 3)|nr:penicillin-binding protein 2 [Gammaproteobacteria bacterium]